MLKVKRNLKTSIDLQWEFSRTLLPRHVLKGYPSGTPYSYRKAKETHQLIFSLLWLAVLLLGACVRRPRRRSRARWRPYSSN